MNNNYYALLKGDYYAPSQYPVLNAYLGDYYAPHFTLIIF